MKHLYTALLAISLCFVPATQTMQQAPVNLDMPVRVVSAGVALLGIKTMCGSSSTKLRSLVRFSVGAALTAAGLIGAIYGQHAVAVGNPSALASEFIEDLGTGFGMAQDALYKLYYGVKRNHTGDLQDHGRYYYYTGKSKLNRQLIAHRFNI